MLKTNLRVALLLATILGCSGPMWAQGASLAFAVPVDPGDSSAWSGTLADANCKQQDLSEQCPVTGETTAFGLVLSNGKFYKFDEAGNAKTLEALRKVGKRTEEMRAQVTGALDGETINVKTIQIQ